MYEKLFPESEIRAWLGSDAHASLVRSYAISLHRAHFRSTTLKQRVHAAAHLVHWIERQGIELRSLDDEGVLESFRAHLGACTCERSHHHQ